MWSKKWPRGSHIAPFLSRSPLPTASNRARRFLDATSGHLLLKEARRSIPLPGCYPCSSESSCLHPKTRSVRPTGMSPACRGLGESPEEKSRGLSAACWTRLLCFLPVRRNQRQRDGMCGEKGRGAPGMLLRGPRAGDRSDGSATALACTTPPGMAAGVWRCVWQGPCVTGTDMGVCGAQFRDHRSSERSLGAWRRRWLSRVRGLPKHPASPTQGPWGAEARAVCVPPPLGVNDTSDSLNALHN